MSGHSTKCLCCCTTLCACRKRRSHHVRALEREAPVCRSWENVHRLVRALVVCTSEPLGDQGQRLKSQESG
eukprot:1158311-Pelagomonas_calceolata.AAC.14